MNFLQFKVSLADFTVFSVNDIRNVSQIFHRRRLSEWQDKGYIKKVLKGYYVFSDLRINDAVLFQIANKIYQPSYISFEMALSFYGLIPEGVYAMTSAATRKTQRFDTSLGFFEYRTLKPSLYFGYELTRAENKNFKIATVEKALLDYLYLNPSLKTATDFLSLRVNRDVLFEQLDRGRLADFEKRFAQKSLSKRLKAFMDVMKNA